MSKAFTYIYIFYLNDLEAVVQLIQQRLPMDGRARSPVAAQSTRLGVSAALWSLLDS